MGVRLGYDMTVIPIMYFPKVAPPAVHGNGAAINNAWKRVKGQNKLTVL
jgi:hypothetical protein